MLSPEPSPQPAEPDSSSSEMRESLTKSISTRPSTAYHRHYHLRGRQLLTRRAPVRAGVHRWTRILGTYFSAQALTQLAGMLAGLLLVRYLPVREFALYTLASSMLTLVAMSSELGSTA